MRAISVFLLVLVCSLLLFADQAGATQDRPDGLPRDARKTRVQSVVDGDRLEARIGDVQVTVRLIGLDAPELKDESGNPECFAERSADRLRDLVPDRSIVYLERGPNETNDDDELLRYVWIVDSNNRPVLLNTKLAREGYAGFQSGEERGKYDVRIRDAARDAKEDQRGLWKECGKVHAPAPVAAVEPTVVPTVVPEEVTPAGCTPEELQYLNTVFDQLNTITQSLERTQVLFTSADTSDPNWVASVAVEFVIWRTSYEGAAAMPVPPLFAAVHSYYLASLEQLLLATNDIVYAIDYYDVASLEAGIARIEEAARLQTLANAELEAIPENCR